MRVLVIHTAYKFKGGEDTVVDNEMALLAANGVEIDLLQFSNDNNTLLKVLFLPFNDSSYWKTIKRIQTFKPDVIHIHNLHFGGSAAVIYAVKRCRIPFVITLHNYRMLCPSATLYANGAMFTDAINKSFSWRAVKEGVYQQSKLLTFWISCSMLLHQKLGTHKLASKYIALGAYTSQLFQNSKLNSIADKIVIKPNFCYNDSVFNPFIGDYYLYIGRLSEEKGVVTLLKAFAENGLRLKIAGTGVMQPDVIDYAQRFPNIEYLNVVDKDGASRVMQQAKALIFPSQWYETFGMVIIEAFSKSVPVIASDLGQLKITIKQGVNGLLFKSGDVTDLIKAIAYYESLLDEEKVGYRRNAFDSYNNGYAPERNFIQLMNIYNSIIGK